ncbi:uncharacterized protein AB9W97_008377 isoform 3-T4 [Spinachia spinachia]
MNFSTTAVAATLSSFQPTSPPPSHPPLPLTRPPEVVTEILTKGSRMDDGVFAALIGAVVFTALLLLVCSAALLLWSSSRHKGSYVTNETEEDQEDREDREDQEDDYRGGNL